MPSVLFSCLRCRHPLADIPLTGMLTVVCARCRLKYQVIRGRVTDSAPAQLTAVRSSIGAPGAYQRQHHLRIELPSGHMEIINFTLADDRAPLVVRPGDVLSAVYLMRGRTPDQLLLVQNSTTGERMVLSTPGGATTRKAWWLAGGVTASVLVLAGAGGASAGIAVALGLATFAGLGVGLGYRRMPRVRLSAAEQVQLTATQKMVAEKLNLEIEQARAAREIESRRELHDRLAALRAKMVAVGLEAYAPRIAVLDGALATIDQQLALERRLRDGYERSIQMLDIEIESGAAADLFETTSAPHLAATLAELRAIEEQQTELGRQLAANVEVEALLRRGVA